MKKLLMKKLLISLLLLGFISSVSAIDAVYERTRPREVKGWHIHVYDDDIDSSAELLTELATTYAQIASADTVELFSSNVVTSASVKVSGVNNNDRYITETITMTAATESTSTATFKYIDQIEMDAEIDRAVILRKQSDNQFINSIATSNLMSAVGQHFNGEKDSYVTYWGCGALTRDEDIEFALRWYPDDADSLDAGDGFKVLDRMFIQATASTINYLDINFQDRTYSQPIRCPAGGWLAVYATGDTTNTDGFSTIQGYDVRR